MSFIVAMMYLKEKLQQNGAQKILSSVSKFENQPMKIIVVPIERSNFYVVKSPTNVPVENGF